MRVVKLGVVGCGWVAATRHLPALRRIPAVQVVAVADINTSRLHQVADRFHIEHRYPNVADLLNNSAIDAIAICVPPQVHVDIALAALEAGKHVFVEKPLALSLDECDQIIERAERSTRKVMVGFNLRWHRLVRHARDMIQRGELGSVELVRTALTSEMQVRTAFPEWRGHRGVGGGALSDLAAHHIDLWRFLLGSEVVEVFAASRSEQWDDETAVVTARMANGVLASSVFSGRTAPSHEVEIFGVGGWLCVSCYRFDGLEFCPAPNYPGDFWVRLRRTARVARSLPRGVSIARYGGEYMASYRAEWKHFISAIQDGTSVECSLEDGRRAVEIALAALRSSSEGRSVSIPMAPAGAPPNPAS